MGFLKGQRVAHSNMAEWGVGEVLDDSDGECVRVLFENVGLKRLNLRYASLVAIDGPRPRQSKTGLQVLSKIDMEEVGRSCELFHQEMTDNRPNTDDGALALHVMSDLNRRGGTLSRSTIRQLSAWCHTDGHPYQRGVALAQSISVAIFGRIIPRVD